MRPGLRLLASGRRTRLVDTGYIKSSFIPVAQKLQLAYPGRGPEQEGVLDAAESRFEQSLSLQALAAPTEKDELSGMMLPRALSLPLAFVAVSRKVDLPAALAPSKPKKEKQRSGEPEETANSAPTNPLTTSGSVVASGISRQKENNKKMRKLQAAAGMTQTALQGPSSPWKPPEIAVPERAKRKVYLANGERKVSNDPLDTRRMREARVRKTLEKTIMAARKARTWVVHYDVQIRPQLSFASTPPRDEQDCWPPARHPDIFFPHANRSWIFLQPAFVRALGDLDVSPAGKMIAQNLSPGYHSNDRDGIRPKQTPWGLLLSKHERWCRGTPLGPTQPVRGDSDPYLDRPLRMPVAGTAEEAGESVIREIVSAHVPSNLSDLAHASLQAEVLVAAGMSPAQAFSLFPSLRPQDVDASISASRNQDAEGIEQATTTSNIARKDAENEESGPLSPACDIPGQNVSTAADAGFPPEQVAEIQSLLSTAALLENSPDYAPGDGFPHSLLNAIKERASALVAFCARYSESVPAVQPNPITLRSLPITQSVSLHLWRLVVWRHQPYSAADPLLRN